jgi:transposase
MSPAAAYLIEKPHLQSLPRALPPIYDLLERVVVLYGYVSLPPSEVLEAHKGQPMIEKRFEQIKTVHEIAPVFLKNEGRIEALFTVYFLALLV